VLRAFCAILILGGLAIAGLGVYSYWTARQGERQAQEQWEGQLTKRPQAPPRAHRGDTIARLSIERLDSHWVVIEGAEKEELQRSPAT